MSYLENVQAFLSFSLLEIGDYRLSAGGLLGAFVIFVVGWFVSRSVRKGLERFARGRAELNTQMYTLGRLLHYAILTVAFLWACSALGISMNKLTIVAGALSVGIGFGLQNIVNNFVSGIIILFEKSLKVGDLIELESGTFGEVVEINIRSTMLRTAENVDILVPNSEFINGRVTNWTLAEDVRRFRIPFGVAYGSDKELVRKAALEAAAEVDHTLDGEKRESIVLMTGFGESSLDFTLVVWVKSTSVKRPGQLTSDYLWKIDDAFRRYNIEIPFPQRDLHLRSGFVGKD